MMMMMEMMMMMVMMVMMTMMVMMMMVVMMMVIVLDLSHHMWDHAAVDGGASHIPLLMEGHPQP